ncbi:pilus motility taxis protein HmpF [Spirulina sp. 06S082]|uniref:pilus motility taxis protein HmpF n=1 Tax=Spirulina sp. 06S082 TaxID=3110248 RepID=UPI002B1F7EF5|nr:pilus motility taxis protein HmpF [Spirulina sp. 06S082]MEA5470665.1 pilus motility taxis protein HmpF [Spirulina sp. 06S082]
MLYLAEVKKQKGGFMSKAATELKLLACQRNDQSWNAVPGDEVIPADEAEGFEQGALILVNLTGNRQVQGTPEVAGPTIVRDLQRLSKLQEKIKTQQEEIEGWKQSLTLQAQELSKREMELDAELAQLEELRDQGGEPRDQGGGQSEDLAQAKAEADRIREEFERKTQELEQAWAHLRGEQRRLEESKEESPSGGSGVGIAPEQAQRIQELLDYLATNVLPTGDFQNSLQEAIAILEQQQVNTDEQAQQFEETRSQAQSQQAKIDRQIRELEELEQQYQSTKVAVEQSRQELQTRQHRLELAEVSIALLKQEGENQEKIYQSLAGLATGNTDEQSESSVDVAALEAMPLEQLQGIVAGLQKELDKLERFVADQEEELSLQQEAVEELEEKLKSANVYESSDLEQELEDEREQKKLLDETLVGQRRTLVEKRSILSQNLSVLRRRQGIAEEGAEGDRLDLSPVLANLEAQRQTIEAEWQKREEELAEIKAEIEEAEATLQDRGDECEHQHNALKDLEKSLKEGQSSTSLLWGRVNLYEEILPPMREAIAEMQQKLQAIAQLSRSNVRSF